MVGPVAQFHENSKYYSAIRPGPNSEVDKNLPHVTIQMPVYKESLKETMCVCFTEVGNERLAKDSNASDEEEVESSI